MSFVFVVASPNILSVLVFPAAWVDEPLDCLKPLSVFAVVLELVLMDDVLFSEMLVAVVSSSAASEVSLMSSISTSNKRTEGSGAVVVSK